MALAERLAELVSFDTQNPDGEERPLALRLASELKTLGARTVDQVDVGDHAYVYARFGQELPRLLINVHLDTVPANTGYTSPPHLLVRRGRSAVRPGRGRHQGGDRRRAGGAGRPGR